MWHICFAKRYSISDLNGIYLFGLINHQCEVIRTLYSIVAILASDYGLLVDIKLNMTPRSDLKRGYPKNLDNVNDA